MTPQQISSGEPEGHPQDCAIGTSNSISNAQAKAAAVARSELSELPLISLILTVKNGMPHLPAAIESIRRQTYTNLELIVQDCVSEDGSSEFLSSVAGSNIRVAREPDSGIGDANRRALARCRGAILGSIDSDNLLELDALARVVSHFAGHPNHAVLYGAVQMITAEGRPLHVYRPGPFDVLRLMSSDLVPPWSTAFFRRDLCGEALSFDAALKTCLDFDVWLRVSHLPIAYLHDVLGSTRLSLNSMSCRPDMYEQFCKDKITALGRYLAGCRHRALGKSLLEHGTVGIYCWAAETLARYEASNLEHAREFLNRARLISPSGRRLELAFASLKA